MVVTSATFPVAVTVIIRVIPSGVLGGATDGRVSG